MKARGQPPRDSSPAGEGRQLVQGVVKLLLEAIYDQLIAVLVLDFRAHRLDSTLTAWIVGATLNQVEYQVLGEVPGPPS